MNAEIIAVGSEITTGDITDTNSAYLSRNLSELGINVVGQTVVPDDVKRIVAALSTAVSRSQLIILTGGLGPTPDDLTKETVCSAVGLELVENSESIERIEKYFARKGLPMVEANRKQALFPEKAVIFENTVGTADGCAIESGNQCIIMLPGPPREMETMYQNSVLPYITKKLDGVVLTLTLKVFGMGESNVVDKLGGILKSDDPVVATYVGEGDIRIKITSEGQTKSECYEKCEPIVAVIKDLLGSAVFADQDISLAQTVVEKLKAQGKQVATAESCTAGLVSKMLTDVPGASSVFEYGVSAYANRVKIEALGVSEQLLNRVGAVSPQVAEAMAEGVRRVSGADIGIATTGYASGGADVPQDKVGLVYISIFDGENFYTRKIRAGHGDNDRDRVRLAAAMNGLDMVRLLLDQNKEFLSEGKKIVIRKETDALDIQPNDKQLVKDETVSDQPDTDHEQDLFEFATLEIDRDSESNIILENAESDTPVSEEDEPEPQPEKEKDVEEEKNKNKKGFKGFIASVIPQKGDTKKNIIRKIAMILCVAVFFGSAGYIADYYYKSYKNNKMQDELGNYFYDENAMGGVEGIAPRFVKLHEKNPEIVGWIKIYGTKTDNPVVKSTTDTATEYEYLYKDFEGKKSKYGTLFVKYNNVFNKKLSANTVIYGHSMKDGQMFGGLGKYRSLDFYRKYPVMEFTPIFSQQTVKWKIFSVMLVDTVETPGHEELFDYTKTSFTSEADHAAFVNEALQRSIIDTPVTDVLPTDAIVTLSTCAYDFTGARLVVMARVVRPGESQEVDTKSASYNGDVVYPSAYRKSKGNKVVNNSTNNVTSNSQSVQSDPSNNVSVMRDNSAVGPMESSSWYEEWENDDSGDIPQEDTSETDNTSHETSEPSPEVSETESEPEVSETPPEVSEIPVEDGETPSESISDDA